MEITRKEIRAKMPAGYKVSLKTVSFMDLARGCAFVATITASDGSKLSRSGCYGAEFYQAHKAAFDALNSLKGYTLEGQRII